MISATVGGTSGIFLVQTTIKSNGAIPSSRTLGTVRDTSSFLSVNYSSTTSAGMNTLTWSPRRNVAMVARPYPESTLFYELVV